MAKTRGTGLLMLWCDVDPEHEAEFNRWYDQEQNEWVIVLKGKAQLLFETAHQTIPLEAGDYVHIPAHVRHRVAWTAPNEPTVWLAVFYG